MTIPFSGSMAKWVGVGASLWGRFALWDRARCLHLSIDMAVFHTSIDPISPVMAHVRPRMFLVLDSIAVGSTPRMVSVGLDKGRYGWNGMPPY